MWRLTTKASRPLLRPRGLGLQPQTHLPLLYKTPSKRAPHTNTTSANPAPTPSSSYLSSHHRNRHPESDLDRHLLRPESYETSKSGTDDAAAHHPWSFDPTITDPALEVLASDAECALDDYREDDPLYVSPGNTEVSRFLDPMAGGAAHNAVKPGCSGMGWTRKAHVFRVRTEPGETGWGKRFERYERVLREVRGRKKVGVGDSVRTTGAGGKEGEQGPGKG
ncbi:hypothetical protein ASPACDRAFT_1857189 [Aspergillus aculeatus ATCC 16872]|uniref:Uncharacterized protein n=1 Tax=Aspergillus aculeatus (strain ATCC 16872 / CBS 172.66 / WB 5094) TaxID=690307 RepID=A0A1L9WR75_ASPA1|nr:uncharacterized protein ASPACDRAFT_1857189 [Aspergillus aculeatus ATCC 16872]OJJ98692.1 hypothetical protein ASPACDRAFT_1857189 [Aspergillus aculeatus ATCC 16872]